MKKFLAILLCLVVMFSLVACGADTDNNKEENNEKVEANTTDETKNEDTTKADDTTADGDADFDAVFGDDVETGGENYCEMCGKNVSADDIHTVAEAYGQMYMCTDCYEDWLELAED